MVIIGGGGSREFAGRITGVTFLMLALAMVSPLSAADAETDSQSSALCQVLAYVAGSGERPSDEAWNFTIANVPFELQDIVACAAEGDQTNIEVFEDVNERTGKVCVGPNGHPSSEERSIQCSFSQVSIQSACMPDCAANDNTDVRYKTFGGGNALVLDGRAMGLGSEGLTDCSWRGSGTGTISPGELLDGLRAGCSDSVSRDEPEGSPMYRRCSWIRTMSAAWITVESSAQGCSSVV